MNKATLIVLFLGVAVAIVATAMASDKPAHWTDDLGEGAEKVPSSARVIAQGKNIYAKACAACHGDEGKGDGDGARLLLMKPRNFTLGQFKLRSTPSGSVPLDEDIYRTISAGIPEYGMPRFSHLSPAERWALVHFIKSLSEDFEDEPDKPIVLGEVPGATDASIGRGREVYMSNGCFKCHGKTGRGDGPSAPTLRDSQNRPAPSLNFHLGPRAFKRGATALDIVNTFRTGLDGTPMPSYVESISEEDAAALAHYVEALATGKIDK